MSVIRTILRTWLAGAAVAAICTGATAQDADSPVEPLRRAIQEERWDDAETELASVRGRIDVDTIDVLFLTGMLALGKQQHERAIDAFRRILDQRPELIRVRLELARVLFQTKQDAAAKYHFERALGGGLPESVQINVRRYLDELRRRRLWALDVGVGLLPDSNINTGTNQQYVTIAGLPFTLSTEAREKSGVGLLASIYASRTLPISPRVRLRAFGSLLRRDYTDSRFDDMIVRAGVGPRWLFGNGEGGFAPFYAERRFGNDLLNRSDGLRFDGTWQTGARWITEGAFEYQRFSYPNLPNRDGGVTWAFTGVRYLLSPESNVMLGLDYYRDAARDAAFRNESTGWTLGHFRDWTRGVSTSLTLRLADTQFEGRQPLFGEYRNERFTTWATSVTKRDWALLEFVPTLSVTYYDNRSSIDFYSFQRWQVLLGFNRRL